MGRTSNKREEILRFLTQFVAENGYAPSVREICAAVGLQSTATVHYHLGALREAGLIEMDDMKKRAITLPDAHRADRIPVVGVVTAGVPILAVENIEGYIPWDMSPPKKMQRRKTIYGCNRPVAPVFLYPL